MKKPVLICLFVLSYPLMSWAQYSPAEGYGYNPKDVNIVTQIDDRAYGGSHSNDGLAYEIECAITGNWVGPICWKTGIVMRVNGSQNYRYNSGQRYDNDSNYCHACNGR